MKIDTENGQYIYDSMPDTCPLCHHGIEPRIIGSNVTVREKEGDVLQILYRCPRHDCQLAFIAIYWQIQDIHGFPEGIFRLNNTTPYLPEEPIIPDEIKTLSPYFVEIFSQAFIAEHYDLEQVAGVGYRKALEFLIKDYCISKHHDKEEEIKNKFVGQCIDNYIDDANIKRCAKRATWLGNDETHYIRNWENKDISDLKILIELTVAWVRNNILTEKYMADMEDAS
jgi:hypothetical protein